MGKSIQLYNTLSGKKENLTPIEPGHIKMYACGVTVYDSSHIGHAMQAIFFDVFRNFFQSQNYKVTYVRNYTDVDDKIIARAEKLGISPRQLANDIIHSNDLDMKNLGIQPATHEPKVSDSIPEIITMVQGLVEKDMAYEKNGDVYYRVRQKEDYGKLSNRDPNELRTGTREIHEGIKEDPLDFALWKKDTTQDASWDSPFGPGRPGWHIECSAMAKKHLGNQFDIHGGGRDLIFPHHENEIAQSESANCCSYANIWIHSGLLTINKQKMSKSTGNSITIKDFLANWPAEILRLGYLLNHYRSNIDFSEEVFLQCRKRLLYFYETLINLDNWALDQQTTNFTLPIQEWETTFDEKMCDDLNTPEALALISVVAKNCNQMLSSKKTPQKQQTALAAAKLLRKWGAIFGIFCQDPISFLESLKDQVIQTSHVTRQEIEEHITARKAARENKDWAASDKIRDHLLDQGILLKDAPEGTTWTIAQD